MQPRVVLLASASPMPPIKEHKTLKKTSGPNSGNPFDPSQRPFILFKGNTVHSTGYNWEHAGAPLWSA
jgi:hypothetical protein